MGNRVASNGKARQWTEEHANACVRAKREGGGISDREIRELIDQTGELYGVTFHKVPSRQRINLWIRDAKVQEFIEKGGKITPAMLRGKSSAILWLVLEKAESLAVAKPAEAAEAVAVVARAAKFLDMPTRVSQPPKAQKPNAETTTPETPGLERLRAAATQKNETGEDGRALSTMLDPSPSPTQDQDQLEASTVA